MPFASFPHTRQCPHSCSFSCFYVPKSQLDDTQWVLTFFTWNRTKFPKKIFHHFYVKSTWVDWTEKKKRIFLVLKLYFFYVSDHNGTTQNSNNSIYRCSEDGTLRIAIKSNPTVRPKTTSGYYTSNKQQFLWSFLYYNSKNKTLHHFPKQIPKI